MKRFDIFFISLSVVISVAIPGFAQQQAELTPPKHVILIGWDGAQRNHLKEALQQGDLPNLQTLIDEGAVVAIDILRITDTKAGWAQILTGYNPEVTGVFSNSKFQPIPAGYTIFERLENFFGADEFVTAAIIGKAGNVGNAEPQLIPVKKKDAMTPREQKRFTTLQRQGTLIQQNGKKYLSIPGEPYYETQANMDVFINSLVVDKKVGRKTLQLLDQYHEDPFFFFVHFAEVDSNGHKHGENSQEYHDALISNDFWTGKIIQKLKKLGIYEDTLIYVTADHGFDEGLTQHHDAPYVFLATNDPAVMRRGERADIAPTILERFGLQLSTIDPPLDGHSLLRDYEPPIW